ncbi:hypothetical protein [Ruania alba]|uniref:hypothetical protein n=1 Tax=Ruania alba TaxID=648782 RepID=UPI000B7E8DCA|nr:hypothetical protein [Ruania alba]
MTVLVACVLTWVGAPAVLALAGFLLIYSTDAAVQEGVPATNAAIHRVVGWLMVAACLTGVGAAIGTLLRKRIGFLTHLITQGALLVLGAVVTFTWEPGVPALLMAGAALVITLLFLGRGWYTPTPHRPMPPGWPHP